MGSGPASTFAIDLASPFAGGAGVEVRGDFRDPKVVVGAAGRDSVFG